MSKEFWNSRYSEKDHLYTERPNLFLKEFFEKQTPSGRVFVPGDGDGRNGLWLARQGFTVYALDYSAIAVQKANSQAEALGLKYKSLELSIEEWEPQPDFFNQAAIIFLHFPTATLETLLRKIRLSLKSGGSLIIQVFAKEQLPQTSGGPKDINLLSSREDFQFLTEIFSSVDIRQEEVILDEGPLHSGKAFVINVIGRA